MDWLLFTAAALFALSVHVETRRKVAESLMDLNPHLAPHWVFGGLGRSVVQAASLVGGLLAAGLLACDWFPLVGPFGATGIFAATLYGKYFISARRSMALVFDSIARDLSGKRRGADTRIAGE